MKPSFHGLLLVNKPIGFTSHDVVARVRRNLSMKEVGHTGTLDPLAEGLMVLLLGEATKMSSYILEQDKQYEVNIKLGVQTDTLDSTGKILNESPVNQDDDSVVQLALKLQGAFEWQVPLYSATKVDGRKLYEEARNGNIDIERPYKLMKYWGIEFLGLTHEHHFRFRINCSKGSFIRTWVHHLGQQLGCGAVMTALVRTSSAPYFLDKAIPLEHVDRETLSETRGFVPLLSALPNFKIIRVSGRSEGLIRNGQISHELRRQLITLFNPTIDAGVKILSQRPEQLLSIVGFEKELGFIVRRVFRY